MKYIKLILYILFITIPALPLAYLRAIWLRAKLIGDDLV